jgi:cytochrome P450
MAETIVVNETQQMLQIIKKEIANGKSSISVMDLLLRSVSNVICTLTMGEQPGYEDNEFTEVMQRIRDNLSESIFVNPAIMFRRVFTILMPLLLVIPVAKKLLGNMRFIFDYIETKIELHENRFDAADEPRDYIDSFLLKKHKLDQADNAQIAIHTFASGQLKREVFDFFITGTDTVSSSLSWGFLLMALHPLIQKR